MTTGAQTAVRFRTSTLEAVAAHARETYPDECCGLILRRDGAEAVRRVRNIQDQLHARDPERYPRVARIAYYMDGKELLDVLNEVDRDGWAVAAFYHSHPDHAAYFSQEDRDRALFDGEPVYPDTAYLIVALDAAAVREVRAFRWDEAAGEFLEAPIAGADGS
ncbi:MAG TPA: M67 family metallopeptidase [Candidatus Sulfotelmatobacter sp.]|nr:M67 family metallopeptidase [Candidatus Sulfotelmatobacter sp.]